MAKSKPCLRPRRTSSEVVQRNAGKGRLYVQKLEQHTDEETREFSIPGIDEVLLEGDPGTSKLVKRESYPSIEKPMDPSPRVKAELDDLGDIYNATPRPRARLSLNTPNRSKSGSTRQLTTPVPSPHSGSERYQTSQPDTMKSEFEEERWTRENTSYSRYTPPQSSPDRQESARPIKVKRERRSSSLASISAGDDTRINDTPRVEPPPILPPSKVPRSKVPPPILPPKKATPTTSKPSSSISNPNKPYSTTKSEVKNGDYRISTPPRFTPKATRGEHGQRTAESVPSTRKPKSVGSCPSSLPPFEPDGGVLSANQSLQVRSCHECGYQSPQQGSRQKLEENDSEADTEQEDVKQSWRKRKLEIGGKGIHDSKGSFQQRKRPWKAHSEGQTFADEEHSQGDEEIVEIGRDLFELLEKRRKKPKTNERRLPNASQFATEALAEEIESTDGTGEGTEGTNSHTVTPDYASVTATRNSDGGEPESECEYNVHSYFEHGQGSHGRRARDGFIDYQGFKTYCIALSQPVEGLMVRYKRDLKHFLSCQCHQRQRPDLHLVACFINKHACFNFRSTAANEETRRRENEAIGFDPVEDVKSSGRGESDMMEFKDVSGGDLSRSLSPDENQEDVDGMKRELKSYAEALAGMTAKTKKLQKRLKEEQKKHRRGLARRH